MDMKEVLKAAIKDALQIALEQGELPEGTYPEAHFPPILLCNLQEWRNLIQGPLRKRSFPI